MTKIKHSLILSALLSTSILQADVYMNAFMDRQDDLIFNAEKTLSYTLKNLYDKNLQNDEYVYTTYGKKDEVKKNQDNDYDYKNTQFGITILNKYNAGGVFYSYQQNDFDFYQSMENINNKTFTVGFVNYDEYVGKEVSARFSTNTFDNSTQEQDYNTYGLTAKLSRDLTLNKGKNSTFALNLTGATNYDYIEKISMGTTVYKQRNLLTASADISLNYTYSLSSLDLFTNLGASYTKTLIGDKYDYENNGISSSYNNTNDVKIQFTYKLGASYELTPNLNIYATYNGTETQSNDTIQNYLFGLNLKF